ncbi:hypothetical protein HDG69_000024 [Isoptericola halotolerans]|uniref:Uncharacterized protein n=1 Tax=Isoptericola halotolerans TaxID=300560 RepID=A0ABX1ZYT3_9MICO|nr:hypothetical protein [Isoptericola halotolerans]
MNSASAISALDSPRATARRTSVSRGVSAASAGELGAAGRRR